jgi:hypothetical protein
MVEIVLRRTAHAEALHDLVRATIGGNRQGDNLAESELVKAVIERGSRRLGGIAAAPIGSGEPPGDFERRGERRLAGNDTETDDTDKARLAGNFDDPLPKAVLLPMGAGPCRPRLVCRRQVLHDAGIGRHLEERSDVLVAPRAQ